MVYLALVDSVNERNKPSCEVSFLMRHAWNPRNHECMIRPTQLYVVCSAFCFPDQFIESEHRGFSTGSGNFNIASPHMLGGRVWRILLKVTEESEPPFSVSYGRLVQGMVVDSRRWSGDLSVVRSRVQIEHAEKGLQ